MWNSEIHTMESVLLRDIFKEGERKAEENGATEGLGGIKVL